ncbi:MAG: alpha-mannosidase, partial [Planctomycetota bacterium]
MLPQTPFYQFQGPRIDAVRDRLKAMCYSQVGDPLTVSRSDPTHEHHTAAEGLRREFKPVEASPTKPHHWGRMWQQAWWKFTIPEAKDMPRRYLRWHDQAEATIFLFDRDHDEWVPHHGLDCGHLFAPLPENFAGEILIESAVVNTGIWVPGAVAKVDEQGSRFEGCTLHTRNDAAWHLWIDFDLLIRVMKLLDQQVLPLPDKPHVGLFHRGEFRRPLDQAPPLLRRMLVLMSEACDALDTQGVAAAREITARLYDELLAAPTEMLVTLTGHAHIDLAWRWPERIADFKAVHTFATASTLMEQYPEFHFGYSQPASYRAVEKRSPGMLRKVRDKIAGGRWEANGVMEVESDTQLPCGEALLRSIELGQQGFRDLTGKDSDVLWLPDVFGYSPCLPQLLQGFGVPHFFTTKIHWGMGTKFPYSAFRWVGHDGSEVTSFIAWDHYNLE